MDHLVRLKNVTRRAVQSWGRASWKRALWNREFSAGRWDHLLDTSGDCIYRYVENYATHGDILDLGCGTGNTANELAYVAYDTYTGVDISDVALAKASERSGANGRQHKNRFVESDIAAYEPDRTYRVILFRESLNYIPIARIVDVLRRYRAWLAPDGVFIVRLYDRNKYHSIVRLIREDFHVVEVFLPQDSVTIVMVFK